jgi:hypothetical protein
MLPKIEVPRLTTTLPKSKIKIDYRPFLGKEAKIIMQALELGDMSQLNNAITDVLNACTFNEINVDDLPVVDVEWLTLQIRAKSVAEVLELVFTCKNELEDGSICGNKILLGLNLTEVGIREFDDHKYMVLFTDSIGVELEDVKYGVYKQAIENDKKLENSILVRNSIIKTVFDENRVYSREDFTEEELDEFLDDLYSKDYEKLENFIKTSPVLYHKETLTCKKCGHKEEYEFIGFDDFLG